MSSFSLLLVPLACISSLDILMRLNPTTNQGSLIWLRIISGLLSLVLYGYVRQFLLGRLLLIYGDYFFMGLGETTITN